MTDKIQLNVIPSQSFPEGMGVTNSGVGLNQMLPGHTKISGNGILASASAAIIGGVPGQFQQNTRIESDWTKDPRFSVKK